MKLKNNLKKLGLHIPYNYFLKYFSNLFGFAFAYLIIFFIKTFYAKDKILCNIFWGSVGHLSVEFDYFFLKMKKLKKPIKIIIFCPNHINNKVIFKNYKKFFRLVVSNNFLFRYMSLISPKYKKQFLDCALSDIKFHFQRPFERRPYHEVAKLYNKYYTLKKKLNLYPFLQFSYDNKNLDNFFRMYNIKKKEYAVIHIKELEGNACALRTSPETYLDTILFLNSIGLKVVFGGREKMPEIFKKFNVINFAESNFAVSYEDDLNLIFNSSFVLGFASGYMCMPDNLNISGVACGFWNIMISTFSKNVILLPAVLNYENHNKLTFKEQMKLAGETQCDFSLVKNIIPVNPTSTEILMSAKQALKINNPSKEHYLLQAKFKNQFKKLPLYYSESPISEEFLKNNIDRL
jgi:hypothetical protein